MVIDLESLKLLPVVSFFCYIQLSGPGLPTMLEQLSRVRADILSLQTKVKIHTHVRFN